jgi:hypothetical protein
MLKRNVARASRALGHGSGSTDRGLQVLRHENVQHWKETHRVARNQKMTSTRLGVEVEEVAVLSPGLGCGSTCYGGSKCLCFPHINASRIAEPPRPVGGKRAEAWSKFSFLKHPLFAQTAHEQELRTSYPVHSRTLCPISAHLLYLPPYVEVRYLSLPFLV